jgi:threonine dehydrogenase-like Zn-dependent dehydrogenase
VTWRGVNEIGVEDVPEPRILNGHDVIVEVGLSVTCGSDLHLMGGYIPAMRAGDVLGHEFMGRIAEVGPAVTKHRVGDRVVVVSFIGCGKCWYCKQGLWSLCDNGNPNPGMTEALWGQSIGGCFGYSHAPRRLRGQSRPLHPGPVRGPGGVHHPGRRLRRARPVRVRCGADGLDRGRSGRRAAR